MDSSKKGKVAFNDFQASLNENPNLLEVYDLLNNGITESIEKPSEKTYQKKLGKISVLIDVLIMEIHKNSLNLSSITKSLTKNTYALSKNEESNCDSMSFSKNFSNNRKIGFTPTPSSKIEPILFDEEEDSFGKNPLSKKKGI